VRCCTVTVKSPSVVKPVRAENKLNYRAMHGLTVLFSIISATGFNQGYVHLTEFGFTLACNMVDYCMGRPTSRTVGWGSFLTRYFYVFYRAMGVTKRCILLSKAVCFQCVGWKYAGSNYRNN